MKRAVVERCLLVLVLLLALGLRFYGLGFSLPYTSHPDEPNVVDRAVTTIKTGDWNPRWFIYPSGYHYMQVGVLSLHLLWGIARGEYASPADLPDSSHVITTAPEAYLWARGTTALFGLLTVFLVYVLGRRFAGPAAGLVGALLLALSPLHAEHSHYVTTDVPTTALALLAVYLSLEVLARGGAGRALLAGLVAGLAGGFKYNGVIAVLPLLVAIGVRAAHRRGGPIPGRRAEEREEGRAFGEDSPGTTDGSAPAEHSRGRATDRTWPLLAMGLLGVVLGYTMACPYTFADLPTFLDDLGYETHIYRFGGEAGVIRTYEVNGRLLPPWQAYAHYLGTDNLPAALVYLAGVVLALVRRRREEMVLLAFVAGYCFFLSSYASIFVRNVLPALPGLTVLGGVFLADGVRWLAGRLPSSRHLARWVPPMLAALAVAITAQPALRIWEADRFRAVPTSQAQARAWLDAHLAPGEKVAAELHPALFARTPYQVTPVDYLSNYPLAVFVNRGYTYLVANSEVYGPEFAQEDTFPDYYLALLNQLEPVADFPGHTARLPGPRLSIFRLSPGPLQPQHELEVTAGRSLRLHGFDFGERQGQGDLSYVRPRQDLRAGMVLALTLYLGAAEPLLEDYVLVLYLRNAEGRAVASLEQPACGAACPLTAWAPGRAVAVQVDMPLAPVLPAGDYRLEAQFLRPGSREPLPLAPAGAEEGLLLLTAVTLLERSP